jgi:hypothetical protein
MTKRERADTANARSGLGALLVVALLIAAVYGLVRGSVWGFVNLAIGGSLLAALVTVQRRQR